MGKQFHRQTSRNDRVNASTCARSVGCYEINGNACRRARLCTSGGTMETLQLLMKVYRVMIPRRCRDTVHSHDIHTLRKPLFALPPPPPIIPPSPALLPPPPTSLITLTPAAPPLTPSPHPPHLPSRPRRLP